MLNYPEIDPVLLRLGGLEIHWYGMMYLFGFSAAWLLGTRRAARDKRWTREQVGDLILREVAMLINSQLRTSDILSRYGGEEFVALLPNTDEESAGEIAARIRSVIAGRSFQISDEKTAQVTISIGVNTLSSHTHDDIPSISAQLLASADQAVYHAKETGRNRVVMASELNANS